MGPAMEYLLLQWTQALCTSRWLLCNILCLVMLCSGGMTSAEEQVKAGIRSTKNKPDCIEQYRRVCRKVRTSKCRVVMKQVCAMRPANRCRDKLVERCRPTTRQVCRNVGGRNVCRLETKRDCQRVIRQVCDRRLERRCEREPRTVCTNEPETRCEQRRFYACSGKSKKAPNKIKDKEVKQKP